MMKKKLKLKQQKNEAKRNEIKRNNCVSCIFVLLWCVQIIIVPVVPRNTKENVRECVKTYIAFALSLSPSLCFSCHVYVPNSRDDENFVHFMVLRKGHKQTEITTNCAPRTSSVPCPQPEVCLWVTSKISVPYGWKFNIYGLAFVAEDQKC